MSWDWSVLRASGWQMYHQKMCLQWFNNTVSAITYTGLTTVFNVLERFHWLLMCVHGVSENNRLVQWDWSASAKHTYNASSWCLKAQFTKKLKFCHHLLTLKYFQTCMNVFVLNSKEDILKNVRNRAVLVHSIFFYCGSQWCPKTARLQTFFRISSFVFSRTNTFIQVWKYLWVI